MNYYLSVLKNYAQFEGRARRSEYWYFFLFNIIIAFVLSFLDVILETGFLNTVYSLLVMIPGIAVAIRRMHDIGKSGWYLLIPFYSLYLVCLDGNHGENEYGEDPKASIPAFV